MTFLNPLVLLGMAAAAIPVLLHLLNLRKLRTVEFSTLTFLKELRQSSIRRLKLRQILLLIVRTLLIIFIVLAFARPALRGNLAGGFGSRAASTIVIILDDSYTMLISDEGGLRLKQAKDAAAHIVDLMKEGDEAYLLKLSDLPKATVDPATHDLTLLRKVIGETGVSGVRRTVEEGLHVASRLLARSANANKEIYIVSDMQETQFAERRERSAVASLFPGRVGVFLVRVGDKPAANGGIDSVALLSSLLEAGRPLTVSALVRNFSAAPVRNNIVSVSLDGTHLAQQNFTAEPWGSATTTLDATPKKSGFAEGEMEIENDLLEFDNHRFFALSIPEMISASVAAETPAEAQFVTLALGAGRSDSTRGGIVTSFITPDRLATLDLRTTDAVILLDIASLGAGDADRLAAFVRRGGGLIIFPSARATMNASASALLRSLGMPAGFSVTAASPGHENTIQRVDFDHPLFHRMFETGGMPGKAKIEVPAPSIARSIVTAAGKSSRVIMTMDNGAPFLTEQKVGDGKVLLFAVSPTLGWSDFPLKGIFAPLLLRAANYVSGRGEMLPSYRCGDEPVLTVKAKPSGSDAQLRLRAPDGAEEILQPLTSAAPALHGAGITLAPRHLTQPGCYRVMRGKECLTMFAVNTDPKESDTRLIAGDEMEKVLTSLGVPSAAVTSIRAADGLQERVLQSRYGVELWRHCLVIALLLALAEMFIARTARSEVAPA